MGWWIHFDDSDEHRRPINASFPSVTTNSRRALARQQRQKTTQPTWQLPCLVAHLHQFLFVWTFPQFHGCLFNLEFSASTFARVSHASSSNEFPSGSRCTLSLRANVFFSIFSFSCVLYYNGCLPPLTENKEIFAYLLHQGTVYANSESLQRLYRKY